MFDRVGGDLAAGAVGIVVAGVGGPRQRDESVAGAERGELFGETLALAKPDQGVELAVEDERGRRVFF